MVQVTGVIETGANTVIWWPEAGRRAGPGQIRGSSNSTAGSFGCPPFPFDTDASSSEGEDCLDEALVSKTPCLGGIFFQKVRNRTCPLTAANGIGIAEAAETASRRKPKPPDRPSISGLRAGSQMSVGWSWFIGVAQAGCGLGQVVAMIGGARFAGGWPARLACSTERSFQGRV